MDSAGTTPVSIRSSCDITILAYRQILHQLPSRELYGAFKTEYDRLKIWAGNIGVYGRSPVSADDRLANDEEMRNLVIKLLLSLTARLGQYQDSYKDTKIADFSVSSDSSSSSCESYLENFTSSDADVRLLRNIRRDTGKLLSILALVRKPTSLASNMKVFTFDFKSLLSDDYDSLIGDFPDSMGFQLRMKFNAEPPYGQCTLPNNLVENLKKAATIRRKALLLRRRHNRKVSGSASAKFAILPDRESKIVLDPINTQSRNFGESGHAPQSQAGSTIFSDTIPSLAAQPLKVERRLSSTQPAPKSTMSVVLMRNRLDVPQPPRCEPNVPEADCYVCGTALNQTLLQQDRWKKHILEDIDPFSCLFAECDTPDLLYKTPHEWYNHMQSHRIEWCCMMPFHRKLVFESESDLEGHLLTAHASKLSREQIGTLLQRGRRAKKPLFEDCPLCHRTCAELGLAANCDSHLSTQDRDAATRVLHRHLESHMYELALFCIPPISDVVTVSQSAAADRVSGRHSEGDQGQRLSHEGLEALPSDASRRQHLTNLHVDWEKALSNDQINPDFQFTYTRQEWEDFAVNQIPPQDLEDSERWLTTCKDIREGNFKTQDGNTDWRESDENLRATFQRFLKARVSCPIDSQRTLFVQDSLCTNSEICKAIEAELVECVEITISPPDVVRDRKVTLFFETLGAVEEAFLDIDAFYINGTRISVQIANEEGTGFRLQSVTSSRQLYQALRNGNLEVVKALRENVGNVHYTTENGWTPLCVASYNGPLQVVRYLFEHGADSDINTPADSGLTPLYAASARGHLEIVKYLLENGGNIHITTNLGWTPLGTASANGHCEVVKYLFECGAHTDVNTLSNDGQTPIYAASRGGHLEVVKYIVEHGADVDIHFPANNGQTPLFTAAYNNYPKVVEYLLEHGADADINNAAENGWTPIYAVSRFDYMEAMQLLLEAGADVNLRGPLGQTPLINAIINSRKEMSRYLIRSSADIMLKDAYGRTAIDWLKLLKTDDELLESLCADPETPSETDLDGLYEYITSLSIKILEGKVRNSAILLHYLGHCLLAVDDMQRALVAFQQQIKTTTTTTTVQHDICCDACSKCPIEGSRFVCKTCPDTDLCESCMEKYHQGKQFAACSGHEYFEVSRSYSAPMDHEALRAWLQDVIDQYTVADQAIDQSHENPPTSIQVSLNMG